MSKYETKLAADLKRGEVLLTENHIDGGRMERRTVGEARRETYANGSLIAVYFYGEPTMVFGLTDRVMFEAGR